MYSSSDSQMQSDLVGCSRWLVEGRLPSVGTWPVECGRSCTRSTGPSLSIACRLLHPLIIDDRPRVLVDVVFALWCRCLIVDVVFGFPWTLWDLESLLLPQMSTLRSSRSVHCELSFVVEFVVIWLISCQTEDLARSRLSVSCLLSPLRTVKGGYDVTCISPW